MNYKFEISKEIFEKCDDFAKRSVGTSTDQYARRNQFNVEKITKDIQIGKIGEEGAWKILSSKFPELAQPDHKVYSKKDKSWSADLIDPSGISIGCKTQNLESANRYGESWVFQGNASNQRDMDKAVFKEKDDKHYACFVLIDLSKMVGEIRAIVKINWLHEKELFKPMKLKHLQNNKSAVYYDDLKSFSDQLWQL